jgi:hypothetical protein
MSATEKPAESPTATPALPWPEKLIHAAAEKAREEGRAERAGWTSPADLAKATAEARIEGRSEGYVAACRDFAARMGREEREATRRSKRLRMEAEKEASEADAYRSAREAAEHEAAKFKEPGGA